MTAPGLLFLPVVGLALLTSWLVRRALRRRRRGWLSLAAAVVAGLLVTTVGVEVWALLLLDRSSVARAIVWRGADSQDWRRFPARPIEAGAQSLRLVNGELDGGVLAEVSLPDGSTTSLRDLLNRTDTSAFLVLHENRIVYERYLDGSSPGDIFTSFSVAKSFLSTLVGIAVARGEIGSVHDPVTDYLPELLDRDPRFERVTLEHLMTMSSGIEYTEHGMPWSDDATTYYAPDLRAAALSAQVQSAPGQAWHYNNYNPLLMGMVLERATGKPVADYMQQVLWQPMGAARDASWSLDSKESGFEKSESGVNATARDFARFGYLFASDGRALGRQVVPRWWVRRATAEDTSSDPAAHYQYWWWVDTKRDGRFLARGNLGQFIYISRPDDIVVVRLGSDFGIDSWPQVVRDVADRVRAAGVGG